VFNGRHGGVFYSIHIFRFAKLQPCVARSPRAVPLKGDVLLAKLARRSLATEFTLTREGLAQSVIKQKFEAVKHTDKPQFVILQEKPRLTKREPRQFRFKRVLFFFSTCI
jgi:hypothetical protein